MKRLFILWVLTFTQWNAFSTNCDLTFDNKEPSHIVEQMEKIYSMDIEQGLLCFSTLKTSLLETSTNTTQTSKANPMERQTLIDRFYGNYRQENLERIEYLMSLLVESSNDVKNIKPDAHPILQDPDLSLIKTPFFTHMNQTQAILSRSIPSDSELSTLEEQIKKLQPQSKFPMFLNPYLGLSLPIKDINLENSSDIPENTEQNITTINIDSTPEENSKQEQVWTETVHIEFPAIFVCTRPDNEMARTFSAASKVYENTLADFISSHADMDFIYTNIMEWIDLVNNQDGQNLQNSHPILDLTTYNMNVNQIPDFILNSMTVEQKESFTHTMNLARKYTWMQNLYFEYRKCFPQVFREHIWISYTAPVPFTTEENPNNTLQQTLSDIDILYEFSSYTAPFASSFKQSIPLRILQESNVHWNDFTSNDIRNRYEPKWNNTLQFLQHFISRNRKYLDVSF